MEAKQQNTLATASGKTLNVSWFGEVPYEISQQAMLAYASERSADDPDQIWLLEHPSVYTQGTACDMSTLVPSDIPVVRTDRGGQITYHGPGQIILYPLLHLKNHQLGVKALVQALEQSVIDLLAGFGSDDLSHPHPRLEAQRQQNAPGVYLQQAKIASLGLRIRRGNSYHGLSLNVDMDLSPFGNIDPCGYQGLQVTQLSQHGVCITPLEAGNSLAKHFAALI